MSLPAPVLTGLTAMPDLTPDGKKQLHITLEPYALPDGVFDPVLVAIVVDAAGNVIDGGIFVRLNVNPNATDGFTQVRADAGNVSVYAYALVFVDNPYLNPPGTSEQGPSSNSLSVDLAAPSPLASVTKSSKGKGHK